MRHDMEEGSKDHERNTSLESKSSEKANSSESKIMLKPSPKPRRGLLAFFSRAEVKEVEDESSYSAQDKEAACQDVPLVLSEEQATLTPEMMRSEQEGLGISAVHSTSQRTLCNVKEKCDQKELLSSANLKSLEGRAGRKSNIPVRNKGTLASRQGYQCALKTEYESPKVGQNVFSDKIDSSSKGHKQEDEGRPSQFDTTNMNNSQSVESLNEEQHRRSCISVKPTFGGGTSLNDDSVSSVSYERLESLSQEADSTDAPQEHETAMHHPSLSPGKEQDMHTYTPPLKLSMSQQEGKAILIKNLRALWEEEKTKYNLGVTKAKVTSDIQAEQSEVASPRDSREKVNASQHDIQAVVSDLRQDHEPKEREIVTENKPQSQWMEDSLKEIGTLHETKKLSPSPETKLSCATNPNQIVNLYTDKSTPRSQRKSQTKAHSPKGQSKIPCRSSKKTRLDRSPLKTYAIDIGAERTDGSISEDHSTTSVKHTRRPSAEETQLQLEQSKRCDNEDMAYSPAKRRRSEQRQLTTCTDEQVQPRDSSTPESARQRTRQSSSGNIQLGQNSPRKMSPEDVGEVKQYGSPSHHGRRTARGQSFGRTFKVREKDVVKDPEARSLASLDRQHYVSVSEQMHVPVFFDRSGKSRIQAEDIAPEEVMGKVSNDSSPSHHSHQSSLELGSSWSSTPEPWSYSWASSAYDSKDTSPVQTMLKRASRPMSLSKSLEDITTMPAREERMRTDQRSDLMLSANDVSVAPSSPTSAPDPEQMKRMSASVPAFLQQESYDRDSDCTSENSFYSPYRPHMRNSHTNHSFSSGMASMSSSVSGSVMSIYSGDFGSVDVKGTIQFAMNYVEKLGEFHIFVVQCRDLAVAEPKRNRSDPYVKCYLLPDKAKLGKRKTGVKKKTLNPTFNEILRYKISLDTLRITMLNLSVWHNDNFGRNSFLGEVDVDLREWSISDTQMKDYLLRPRVVTRPSTTETRGDMRVALRFLPQVTQSKRSSKAGEVQIWVRECKNLPVVRGVIIDPFVKCTVLPDTSRKGRQKTRVAKKTADPVFNHTMVYDGFKPEDLREACVELTVWDHDRLSNHFLGGLRLGLGTGKSYGSEVTWMDSTSDEATLWNRMMISQGEWVEDVLPLRMLMMAK
ncbi:synaptotagmin-like protein 2 isoform X1 [Sardina pilchardus]|uniref:synaptotagmin-like protein 2 isoform X1 n=1 Tax=Sardina pilchardus TaxID=27697 RepID=UPI002E0DB52F